MVTRACLRYAREGQNVTQAGPKCHTSRAKMSHKGQNVTQSCYNIGLTVTPLLICWSYISFALTHWLATAHWRVCWWTKPSCYAAMLCIQHQAITWSNFYHHDDVIKWKHFPRYWPFVLGIHWSPVNSPHNGQWCGSLMFSLICTRINGWINNGEAGDLRCHRAHCDVFVMM